MFNINYKIIMALCLLFSGCTTIPIDDTLNAEFAGKKVYLCEDDNKSGHFSGERTINKIECHYYSSYNCQIYFTNEYGDKESIDWWAQDVTDLFPKPEQFVQSLKRYFHEQPFCSYKQFKEYEKKQPLIIKNITSAQKKADLLKKDKNVFNTLETFADLFMRKAKDEPVCKENIIYSHNLNLNQFNSLVSIDDKMSIIQQFAKSGINTKCHMTDFYQHYLFDTDECIIDRRNNKSSICFFDYNSFLPASSKIKNEEQFLKVVNAYLKLFRVGTTGYYIYEKKFVTYCEQLKEATTDEKKQCEQNAKQYLLNLVENKVPHCRNTVSKEYYDFLKEFINTMSLLHGVTMRDFQEKLFVSTTSKNIAKGLYSGFMLQAMVEKIDEFGLYHFCDVSGFENDISKIK